MNKDQNTKEADNAMMTEHCPDCHCAKDQFHRPGCDLERCAYCGLQYLCCDHAEQVPDDDRMRFNGSFPDQEACEELGLFAKLVPGQGWVACNRDEPGAFPDLNTLYATCQWNRQEKRWQRRRG